jgi:putative Mn2+ efflux pump MntP
MFALIVAAIAVGLSNFGAAISIGLSGTAAATRIRVGVVFGVFEAGMPLVGLLLGHSTAQILGEIARYVGGALLVLMGSWQLLHTARTRGMTSLPSTGIWRLLVTGFALSLDNLVVGFTLGIQHAPLVEAISVFAAVSVALSLLGIELGRRLSSAIKYGVEYVAGFVLVAVGLLVAVGDF